MVVPSNLCVLLSLSHGSVIKGTLPLKPKMGRKDV